MPTKDVFSIVIKESIIGGFQSITPNLFYPKERKEIKFKKITIQILEVTSEEIQIILKENKKC